MIDLEDLPRLQSLSPAKDIEDTYHQTQLQLSPKKVTVTVRVPIGPPSKLTKLIKPTVASTPAVLTTPTPASLETPPTPQSSTPGNAKNNIWRGGFHFTTLVSKVGDGFDYYIEQSAQMVPGQALKIFFRTYYISK